MSNEEMNNPGLPGNPMPEELDTQSATPDMPDRNPTPPKKDKKDQEAIDKTLEEMMYSPSSGDADSTVTIDKTTDEEQEILKPDTKALLEILEKGDGELSAKYQKELLDKALKDPTSVEVKTPRGWMTVKDAIGDGFNLVTNDFTDEPIPKVDWEGEISKLDPREQETIRRLTRPGTRQAGPSSMQTQGGDVIPGPTGEPLPEQATGAPANNIGAMDKATMGGTELPLGGV